MKSALLVNMFQFFPHQQLITVLTEKVQNNPLRVRTLHIKLLAPNVEVKIPILAVPYFPVPDLLVDCKIYMLIVESESERVMIDLV